MLGLPCRYTRILFCLGCSIRPSTNIFSSPYTISIPLSSSPSKLGKQSCWAACLLVCACLWSWVSFKEENVIYIGFHTYDGISLDLSGSGLTKARQITHVVLKQNLVQAMLRIWIRIDFGRLDPDPDWEWG